MISQFVGKSMPLSESGLTNVCSQLGRGLCAAMTAAFYVFLKYAKVYERQLKDLHPR